AITSPSHPSMGAECILQLELAINPVTFRAHRALNSTASATVPPLLNCLVYLSHGSEGLIMVQIPDANGDPDLGALFDRYKERLRRTVRLRLDRRLTGLVDSSGVLELVRQQATRRSGELAGPGGPGPFLWLRQVTGQVLARLHQDRLGPDARGDISLYRGALPEATSVSLAAHLLGKAGGEDDRAAARA